MNKYIPKNVFLLSGDCTIELLAEKLSHQMTAPDFSADDEGKKKFLCAFRRFVYVLTRDSADDWCIFVDTNPTYASVFTRIALCTGDELIMPFSPDEFSVSAVRIILIMLTGRNLPERYKRAHFKEIIRGAGLELPTVSLAVMNMCRPQNEKGIKAHADVCRNMADTFMSTIFPAGGTPCPEILTVKTIRRADGTTFTLPRTGEDGQPCITREEFEAFYVTKVSEFNTAGVISNRFGIPFTRLRHYYPAGSSPDGRKPLKLGRWVVLRGGWCIQDIIMQTTRDEYPEDNVQTDMAVGRVASGFPRHPTIDFRDSHRPSQCFVWTRPRSNSVYRRRILPCEVRLYRKKQARVYTDIHAPSGGTLRVVPDTPVPDADSGVDVTSAGSGGEGEGEGEGEGDTTDVDDGDEPRVADSEPSSEVPAHASARVVGRLTGAVRARGEREEEEEEPLYARRPAKRARKNVVTTTGV
jgi:hypothetical protein